MHNKGITLIEMIIVVGGLALLAVLSIPVGVTFLQRQILDETALQVANYINHAHMRALSGKGDTSHGVRVSTDDLTLFVGDSYVARDTNQDVIYPYPIGVGATTSTDVVFENVTGTLISPLAVTLQIGDETTNIYVTELGQSYVQ